MNLASERTANILSSKGRHSIIKLLSTPVPGQSAWELHDGPRIARQPRQSALQDPVKFKTDPQKLQVFC